MTCAPKGISIVSCQAGLAIKVEQLRPALGRPPLGVHQLTVDASQQSRRCSEPLRAWAVQVLLLTSPAAGSIWHDGTVHELVNISHRSAWISLLPFIFSLLSPQHVSWHLICRPKSAVGGGCRELCARRRGSLGGRRTSPAGLSDSPAMFGRGFSNASASHADRRRARRARSTRSSAPSDRCAAGLAPADSRRPVPRTRRPFTSATTASTDDAGVVRAVASVWVRTRPTKTAASAPRRVRLGGREGADPLRRLVPDQARGDDPRRVDCGRARRAASPDLGIP